MAIRKVKSKTKGVRYSVRMHVGDGKYKVIGTWPSRAVAREEEAKWIARHEDARTGSRRTGKELADFYLEGLRERVRQRTYKDSSLHHAEAGTKCWSKTFGGRDVRKIQSDEAEEWARENRWAVPAVVTMMNYAVKKEMIDRNRFSGLTEKGPGRKELPPLSVEEVAKLAEIATRLRGQGMRAFVLVMAYSGMRNGEMFALQPADLDFGKKRIKVRQRLYRGSMDLPKSNVVREIVMLPEAEAALRTLDLSGEWVFTSTRGKRLSQNILTYYWQGIEAAFGREIDPYELRHFCGHYMYVTREMADRLVAVQLGHNDGGILVRKLYGHGDHGALGEIDRLLERDNVVPLRKAAGE